MLNSYRFKVTIKTLELLTIVSRKVLFCLFKWFRCSFLQGLINVGWTPVRVVCVKRSDKVKVA